MKNTLENNLKAALREQFPYKRNPAWSHHSGKEPIGGDRIFERLKGIGSMNMAPGPHEAVVRFEDLFCLGTPCLTEVIYSFAKKINMDDDGAKKIIVANENAKIAPRSKKDTSVVGTHSVCARSATQECRQPDTDMCIALMAMGGKPEFPQRKSCVVRKYALPNVR